MSPESSAPRRPRRDEPIDEVTSVFVPAPDSSEGPPRRWPWIALGVVAALALVAVGVIVAWPRVNPRRLDPVERVAEAYLQALVHNDAESARRLGTVEEPPGISSVRTIRHDRSRERRLRGSFAPLGEFHSRINAEYVYDSSIGRFTPKNPLGPAAETLDALHKAKEDAEKSGLYDKMQSGKPDDIFDAAEEYGKVFTKLAEGVLAPKKILPTYQMLVESAKPPLPEDAKALALEVAKDPKEFDALLKRPFLTLKADGPFIYDQAVVNATVADRLASLGDSPSRLRLELVRFQLEGIDTGWKVVSARRGLPKAKDEAGPSKPPHPASPGSETSAPDQTGHSPGEVPSGP
jgi:hypothetical protein